MEKTICEFGDHDVSDRRRPKGRKSGDRYENILWEMKGAKDAAWG